MMIFVWVGFGVFAVGTSTIIEIAVKDIVQIVSCGGGISSNQATT